MSVSVDVEALTRLAEAATPGPWDVDRIDMSSGKDNWHIEGVLRWRNYVNVLRCDEDEATARYIAAVSPDVVLALLDRLKAAEAATEELKAAILDIDAHAIPLGEDDDGFVAVGYAVSVGAIHRALGKVGHSAAKCADLPCERARIAEADAAVGRWVREHPVSRLTVPEKWAASFDAAFPQAAVVARGVQP